MDRTKTINNNFFFVNWHNQLNAHFLREINLSQNKMTQFQLKKNDLNLTLYHNPYDLSISCKQTSFKAFKNF